MRLVLILVKAPARLSPFMPVVFPSSAQPSPNFHSSAERCPPIHASQPALPHPLPSPGLITTPLPHPLSPVYAWLTPILQSAVSCILSLAHIVAPQPLAPIHSRQVHPSSAQSQPNPPPLCPSPGLKLTPAKVACRLAHGGASLFGQPSPGQGESYTGGCARFHFPSCLYFRLCVHSVFPLTTPC